MEPTSSTATSRVKEYFMFDISKIVFYTCALLYVVLAMAVVMLEPFMELDCQHTPPETAYTFHNAQFVYNPCRYVRHWKLLGLNQEECTRGRRLVWAVILGCLIGWERRNADRPAGIRTMALVSLGACLFSICSTFAFLSGPMAWDSSRVSAAIPSGVGFLGSALIFKHTTSEENAFHEVHGLTTAASVWLSAAVGIACAGGLYFSASLSTAIVLVMLRFGPRTRSGDDEEEEEEDNLEFAFAASWRPNHPPLARKVPDVEDTASLLEDTASLRQVDYNATRDASAYDPEMQSIIPPKGSTRKGLSKRSLRPSLMG